MKYLFLMLLTPLALSEVQEFYCLNGADDFFTLKINTDSKNPLFTIENRFSYINNKNYNQENIDVKKLRVTVFDDVVVTDSWLDDREGRKDYERYKKRMLNNNQLGFRAAFYDCIKNTVKF